MLEKKVVHLLLLLFCGLTEAVVPRQSHQSCNQLSEWLPNGCTCNSITLHKGVMHCQNLSNLDGLTKLFDAFKRRRAKFSPENVSPDNNNTNLVPSGFDFSLDLNLSHNSLRELSQGCFNDAGQVLEQLDLSHNQIVLLNDWFESQSSLRFLDLSHNRLSLIATGALSRMPYLTHLDLSFNALHTVEATWFPKPNQNLTGLNNLIYLNLSYSKIYKVNPRSFQNLTSLESLDLSNNELLQLPAGTFRNLPSLKELYLENNELTKLDSRVIDHHHKLTNVTLLGNQWNCSSSLGWIHGLLKVDVENEISHKGPIFCHSPDHHKGKTLLEWIKHIAVQSSFANSNVCKTCLCSVDKFSMGEVDCRNRSLDKLPGDLPYSTGTVRLEENRIRSVAVEPLYEPRWATIRHLYLDGNLIDSLKPMEGKVVMKNMIRLSLTRNRLREIPVHQLDQFPPSLTDIFLSENPWTCQCNTVRFRSWLLRHLTQIKDIAKIRCHDEGDGRSTAGQAITYLMNSELCPQPPNGLNYLDLLNLLMVALIILILAKLLYDWRWQKRTGKLPNFFKIQIK